MTEPLNYQERSERTAELIEQLHQIVFELEELHPGRKFTPDGHLVGSIGEAAAEALFDLTLATASTAGHDAVDSHGRKVEIKATYGGTAVMIRPTSEHAAQHLVVIVLSKRPEAPHEAVYNGPLAPALQIAGPIQSNGQARIGIARLQLLDKDVPAEERVPRREIGSHQGADPMTPSQVSYRPLHEYPPVELDAIEGRMVVPFYLKMMNLNVTKSADLDWAALLEVGSTATLHEVHALLGTDLWRPVVMGAWFSLKFDPDAVGSQILAAVDRSLGSLTAPPLATAAAVVVGPDAIPTLKRYVERDLEHGYGSASFVNAIAEHLGGRPVSPSPRETQDLVRRMLDVAHRLSRAWRD